MNAHASSSLNSSKSAQRPVVSMNFTENFFTSSSIFPGSLVLIGHRARLPVSRLAANRRNHGVRGRSTQASDGRRPTPLECYPTPRMATQIQRAVLLIADIGGYTRFMKL